MKLYDGVMALPLLTGAISLRTGQFFPEHWARNRYHGLLPALEGGGCFKVQFGSPVTTWDIYIV